MIQMVCMPPYVDKSSNILMVLTICKYGIPLQATVTSIHDRYRILNNESTGPHISVSIVLYHSLCGPVMLDYWYECASLIQSQAIEDANTYTNILDIHTTVLDMNINKRGYLNSATLNHFYFLQHLMQTKNHHQ